MILLDASSCDAADNLAVDARLFREVEEHGAAELLRFWHSASPAVVLGQSGSESRDVHQDACRGDGVPIVRRFSGGGAVVVGPGCLSYSLVLSLDRRPELRDVTRSYRNILGRLRRALGLERLAVRGTGDLALGMRKVAGSAQRRGRRALLHHGTLLHGFDAGLLERYLKAPLRQPRYRRGRSHRAFVGNLPLSPEELRSRLVRAWIGEEG